MTSISITPTNEYTKPMAEGEIPKSLGLNLAWDKAEKEHIKRVLACYPKEQKRSGTIPLLKLAQDKCGGWLPVDAMQLVADTLGEPYMRVYEVATFYTMFNLKPVGKFHVQVCTNCSCLISGSDGVVKAVKDFTGIQKSGANSQNGDFTFTEVECLGACVSAPLMQVGSHYYTKLDATKTQKILKHLQKGGDPKKFADTPPANPDPISKGEYKERV